MRSFAVFVPALLAYFALAQSQTDSAPGNTATSVPDLASKIGPCAAGCLTKVIGQIGCGSNDLKCLCADKGILLTRLVLCGSSAGCTVADLSPDVGTWLQLGVSDVVNPTCNAVNPNNDDDEGDSINAADRVKRSMPAAPIAAAAAAAAL
ncbi:hypothetical protein CPAR01_01678 [Colletotrichum paranaense]|uniref:CFEM domain-containing protein n=1 Tax=Colletotrichum paranaense TaxID=1914294 RepID=A0ABQ9T7F0_9PEZI|nr:uncharacterized protein CPAR01_01678 [Colletotrichum paranaense]KAK1547711.1 hypothetical protein CPAR01_01678 [Colletotrichum paranaense]